MILNSSKVKIFLQKSKLLLVSAFILYRKGNEQALIDYEIGNPDIITHKISKDDEFFVLACDGKSLNGQKKMSNRSI